MSKGKYLAQRKMITNQTRKVDCHPNKATGEADTSLKKQHATLQVSHVIQMAGQHVMQAV